MAFTRLLPVKLSLQVLRLQRLSKTGLYLSIAMITSLRFAHYVTVNFLLMSGKGGSGETLSLFSFPLFYCVGYFRSCLISYYREDDFMSNTSHSWSKRGEAAKQQASQNVYDTFCGCFKTAYTEFLITTEREDLPVSRRMFCRSHPDFTAFQRGSYGV